MPTEERSVPLRRSSPSWGRFLRTWCLVLLGALAACSRGEAQKTAAPPAPGGAPREPDEVSAPFDVGSVVRRVHFSYRPEGSGWRAGHSTYEVKVAAGSLALTPFHASQAGKGAPLKLGAARLSRGDRVLGTAAPRGRVEADGHLALGRNELSEHLRNGEDGVEQSWAFDRAPEGKGDVLVRIPVQGLTYTGATTNGLHFADEDTGLGFRYGHATWVDHAGRRTQLRAEYAEGHIHLRVPGAVVDSSAYPAVLDPLISPEFGMDNPVTERVSTAEGVPAVASNGSNYLVIWTDSRRGGGTDIYGTRVGNDGQVLDIAGINLSIAAGNQSWATVASNGTDYFVVWRDDRGATTDIYGTRVTASGTVQDPDGLPIYVGAGGQRNPAIASAGSDYLIVWEDARNGDLQSDIYGTWVSSQGVVVDPAGFVISSATNIQAFPVVASNGTDYFVIWQDLRSGTAYYGARVSGLGPVLDPAGIRLVGTPGLSGVGVASNGADYLVVWADNRTGSADIYGTRVTSQGVVLDPSGLTILNAPDVQGSPSVAFDGSRYLVAWYDNRTPSTFPAIYGARVTSAGVVQDPGGLLFSTPITNVAQVFPAVASAGSNFFVVWRQDGNMFGTRVSGSSGAVLDPPGTLLTSVVNWQFAPDVATNGTNFLVVWHDTRGDVSDIYGTRVSLTGDILDPLGLAISTAANSQSRAAVASNGTDYLVVWEDQRNGATLGTDIYGTRVTSGGAVLDSSLEIVHRGNFDRINPDVASNGTDYFVVWSSNEGTSSGSNIYGTTVTSGGVANNSGSGIPVCGATGSQIRASIAFNETTYLVAWTDLRSSGGEDIYGNLVSAAGVPGSFTGFPISAASGHQELPRVASNGADFFVVWDDYRGDASGDVYGARVSGAGTVLDTAGVAIFAGANAQNSSNVGSDGSDYFVAWQDFRSGSSWDVYGTEVSSAGIVKTPTGLLIAGDGWNEQLPAIAPAAPRQFLVVYQRYDGSSTYNNERIRGRFVTLNRAPSAVGSSVQLAEDTSAAVTLTGTDPDGDPLSFAITAAPAHGTLSGTPPNLTYTPAPDYSGPDTFSFTVTDVESIISAPATVSLTIDPVNDPPVAVDASVTLDEDGSQAITVAGSDVDGDALIFSVNTMPSNGALTGTPPDLTYTPAANYHGSDSFTFQVSDGVATATATVSIAVQPVNDVPVAVAQSLTTAEDAARAILLSGTDVDGDSLTYSVVMPPGHGTLTGTPPNVTYIPAADYNGSDSFSFTVRDPAGATSALAAVSLTVTPVNDAPVALAQSISTAEDTPRSFTLQGTDIDGDALTYEVTAAPAHGTLSGTPPGLTYTPAADYQGSDSFTFTVRDPGGATSAPATLGITVTPVNDAPVAQAQSLTTPEDTARTLTLTASDVEGDPLSYSVVTPPAHGTLTGTPPNLTYAPAADYSGPDSFTFRVNDGAASSNAATVSIAITPVNDAPVAQAQSLTTPEDTARTLTLTASDVEGDPLSYSVVTPPAHGTLTGTPPNLTYAPAADYSGPDSFTFRVNDGAASSNAATVSIAVTPVNDAPVAQAQSLTTPEDTARTLTLTASDVEGDPLSYSVVSPPAHGTLTGTPPNLTYTPAADYSGPDSFTFRANDGAASSNAATVSIAVTPVNDAPVAQAQSLTTPEDTARTLTLTASDVEGDPLSYSMVTPPAHGSLTGTPPNLTYTPAADYSGPDSFTFRVNDGAASSNAATVSIAVSAVNDAPAAQAQSLTTPEDTALAITLSGTDIDGDSLTYSVATPPAHGTLTGAAPNLTYTPAANYQGPDSFAFAVTDPSGASSAPATIGIDVTPVNDAPLAQPQSLTTPEDTALAVTLSGTDVDGTSLTYAASTQPAHGTLSGTPPNLTYTPAANYHGSDSFTFTASDGSAISAPATVSLTISPVNDAPTAFAQDLATAEDMALALTLTSSDIDGDSLAYTFRDAPAHGALAGTPPNLTYTPAGNFHGADSFTFEVSDGVERSSATVSLTVTPVNDAPVAIGMTLPVGTEPAAITLSATDVDGDALSYSIETQPSHGTLSGTPPAVTYTPDTSYRGTDSFSFAASDGQASSAPATISLTVGNRAPEVTLSADSLQPLEGESIHFQAMAVDANMDPLTFSWDFGDGTTSEEQNPSHTYANQGAYDVVLQVSDGIATVQSTLRLEVQNAAPVIVPLESPATAEEGKPLTLRAQASDQGSSDTLSFSWDFGDGSAPATSAETPHTYADNGVYTVKVTVTDDSGAFTQATREVHVANMPPVPEQVPPRTVQGGETVEWELKATDAAGSHDPLTWSLLEGPGTLDADGTYRWTPEPSTQGDHIIRAQVADDDNGTAEVLFTVTVTPKDPTSVPESGCACASGTQGAASSMAFLLLLAAFARRRARVAPRPLP